VGAAASVFFGADSSFVTDVVISTSIGGAAMADEIDATKIAARRTTPLTRRWLGLGRIAKVAFLRVHLWQNYDLHCADVRGVPS
jgi:hypothetical protein